MPASAAVPTDTDVLVVGAGPAGAAAAAWAARAGRDVVLADAAVFPRDKACGDGLTPRAIAELSAVYAELVAAGTVLGERSAPDDLVGTQGHVLRADDLLSTLAVEAAVHHLDLVVRLDRPGPSPEALAEVRRVLEGLLGGPLPDGWDDGTAARRGTGREPLTDADRAELGERAGAFPLFG